MSILNVDISKFENVRDTETPVALNLLEWLSDDSDKAVIQEVRTLSEDAYKEGKRRLPGITPSGTFKKRCESGLVEHSGLIQFDVDRKDNPVDMGELKENIQLIPYVAYLSLSTSGNGLWGLIPIQYPERHRAQFQAIYKAFLNAGVTIDRAPSNVASFRFTSHDSEPYYNHNAVLFPYLIEESTPQSNGNNNRENVEQLIDKIRHSKVDITDGYDNWLKIGFALAEEFGESARGYFHAVSQFHQEYNERECDRQFTNCIQANGKGVSISSFFHICQQYGITLDTCYAYQKDSALQGNFESNQSAPYGMNPYTGEIFDSRGYPADWDNINLN